jgi:hypothetical protein
MNLVALEISKLPFSTFNDFYLSITQAIWLAIILYICSAKFISWKEKFRLNLIFSCMVSVALWVQFIMPTYSAIYVYTSYQAIGIIEHTGNAAKVTTLKEETFANSYFNRSIEAFKKYAIQNQLTFQSSLNTNSFDSSLGCQLTRLNLPSSTVFFIHPENLRVNPFDKNLNFRLSDTVFLMAGGTPKKRQLWRLALLRRRIQLIDAQSNKILIKKLM